MAEPRSIFAPGLIAAVVAFSKSEGIPVAVIARRAGIADAVLRKVGTAACTVTPATFDKLLKVVPEPWTRNHCKLDERPAWIAKAKVDKEDDLDEFRYKAITTPHLDAFNGVFGGWY